MILSASGWKVSMTRTSSKIIFSFTTFCFLDRARKHHGHNHHSPKFLSQASAPSQTPSSTVPFNHTGRYNSQLLSEELHQKLLDLPVTISEHDTQQGLTSWNSWREITFTTSPSNQHLGHYVSLLDLMAIKLPMKRPRNTWRQ